MSVGGASVTIETYPIVNFYQFVTLVDVNISIFIIAVN